MTPAARLRPVLPEIVAGLECFARVPRDAVPDVIAVLRDAVADSAYVGLKRANAERSARIRAAIRRAAGFHLTPRVRETCAPRYWTGMLAGYLQRRYSEYGLDAPPSLPTIRNTLKEMKERVRVSLAPVEQEYPADGDTEKPISPKDET